MKVKNKRLFSDEKYAIEVVDVIARKFGWVYSLATREDADEIAVSLCSDGEWIDGVWHENPGAPLTDEEWDEVRNAGALCDLSYSMDNDLFDVISRAVERVRPPTKPPESAARPSPTPGAPR